MSRACSRLAYLGKRLHEADTADEKAKVLYELRCEITEDENLLQLILEMDEQLYSLEPYISEETKYKLRCMGYQFPEDLDNVPELLRGF